MAAALLLAGMGTLSWYSGQSTGYELAGSRTDFKARTAPVYPIVVEPLSLQLYPAEEHDGSLSVKSGSGPTKLMHFCNAYGESTDPRCGFD